MYDQLSDTPDIMRLVQAVRSMPGITLQQVSTVSTGTQWEIQFEVGFEPEGPDSLNFLTEVVNTFPDTDAGPYIEMVAEEDCDEFVLTVPEGDGPIPAELAEKIEIQFNIQPTVAQEV